MADSGLTPTGGGKSKFKSKFASGASSKFLAKTPTNDSGSTSFDSYNNNNDDGNESKINNNEPSLGMMMEKSTSGLTSINSVTSPMSYTSKQEGIPNTDFNESDGRDVKILGATHQLPLQYRWTLWHTAPKTKQQGWTDNYKQIASFDTVGTFWQLFNNIAPPTMLREGSSYHLFKGKVEPMWEDKFNKGGGSWTYRFGDLSGKGKGKGRDRDRRGRHSRGNDDRNNGESSNIVNYAWYYTVLNMIGNNFNYNENICGIVISIRKGGRGKIELWIKDARDRRSTESIGRDFKMFSGARKRNVSINFISHDDNKNGRRNCSWDL